MKKVWAQSGQCGLNNRQGTLQITVFADGVNRVRPTVIFPGKGLRISAKEKQTKLWPSSEGHVSRKGLVWLRDYEEMDFYRIGKPF